MGLNSWERRALAAIEESLAASAAELVSLLTVFNRLTAGEEMPAHSRIRRRLPSVTHRRPRRRRPAHPLRYQQARQFRALQRLSRACVVLWVMVSAAMIAVAVALSGAGPQTCLPWKAACGPHAQARVFHAPAGKRA